VSGRSPIERRLMGKKSGTISSTTRKGEPAREHARARRVPSLHETDYFAVLPLVAWRRRTRMHRDRVSSVAPQWWI
jgi:hypothetical protein